MFLGLIFIALNFKLWLYTLHFKLYALMMTGIVLVGGKAHRLNGKEKSLFKVGTLTILERIIQVLAQLTAEIILVSGSKERAAYLEEVLSVRNSFRKINPPARTGGGVKIVPDEIPGKGPLGGILTGLKCSSSFYNLVVGGDLPFLNLKLIKFLEKECEGLEVTIPSSPNGLEPLQAIYSKSCILPIERSLAPLEPKNKENRIISFFKEVKVKYVSKEEVKKFDPQFLSFFNVNTFKDLKLAQKMTPPQGGRGHCERP